MSDGTGAVEGAEDATRTAEDGDGDVGPMPTAGAHGSQEFQMRQLLSEHMNDAAHTYKTFYYMMDRTQRYGDLLNVAAMIGAALLTISLVVNAAPAALNVLIAVLVGGISGVNYAVDFDAKASLYEDAGDQYNSLFKEFKEYYRLTYLDESTSTEKKRAELRELTRRHRRINELTPATADWAYDRVDTEAVLENIETTPDERERLLS